MGTRVSDLMSVHNDNYIKMMRERLYPYLPPNMNISEEIKSMNKQTLLNQFNDESLEKVATFLLNSLNNNEIKNASIEDARNIVEKWKSEATNS